MCGRFTLRTPAAAIAEQFALLAVPDLPPGSTLPPASRFRSSACAATPQRELVWLRWGLVPSWAKDPAIGNRLINARAESAAEKPAFRAAMRRRRCLIVADGFYEWQQSGPGEAALFHSPPRRSALRLRGPVGGVGNADHSTLETCTILTTAANELVRPIHDRMPVILPPAASGVARSGNRGSAATHAAACAISERRDGSPAGGDFVNSPSHDSPQCIEAALQKGNITLPGM